MISQAWGLGGYQALFGTCCKIARKVCVSVQKMSKRVKSKATVSDSSEESEEEEASN